MGAYAIDLGPAVHVSETITDSLFGVNTIFTKDFVDDGSFYSRFVDSMGVNSFRYPGGTVTEEKILADGKMLENIFDFDNNGGIDPETGERILTAKDFFQFVSEHNGSVDLVLPTMNFFTDELDDDGDRIPNDFGIYMILEKVSRILSGEFGNVTLDTVSIGNEYWYKNERMSASEYGKMANVMSKGLQHLFDVHREGLEQPETWIEPKIAVQSSLGYEPEESHTIIDQLDMEAREAIDAVETHFYPVDYVAASTYTNPLKMLDIFQNADGFGELDYFVSEWNIRADFAADQGLSQASSLVETFQSMVERGVDRADIWGTTYKSLSSSLAVLTKNPDAVDGLDMQLTPAGQMFKMMAASLEGTRALNIKLPSMFTNSIGLDDADRPDGAEDQFLIHGFEGAGKTVLFISSRTDGVLDLDINIDTLIPNYAHVWGQLLSAVDDPGTGKDESDPLGVKTLGHIETMGKGDLIDAGELHVSLDPYEIIKVEFSTGSTGVHMFGDDQIVDPEAEYDDKLVGGAGNDTIEGFVGDDTLYGMRGDDYIDGGAGNDVLTGNDGNDTLVAGAGNDKLFGGEGNDILVADAGNNMLVAGNDVTHFVVNVEGINIIHGFDAAEGDTLSFLRAYDSVGAAMKNAVVDGNDILFAHEAGGVTELVGAADQFDSLKTSLSDFMADSPVQQVVDDVLGFEHPEADLDEEYVLSNYDLANMFIDGETGEISDFFKGMTPEQISAALKGLDLNVLLDLMDDKALPAFLNSLNGEALEDTVDQFSPKALFKHFAEIGMNAQKMLDVFNPDAADALTDRLADGKLALPGGSTGSTDTPSGSGSDLGGVPFQPGSDTSTTTGTTEEEDNAPDQASHATYSGSECFVATAAYADQNHPDVAYLRQVRDRFLVHFWLGRVFIWVYWRVGPRLARALAPYPRGRAAARAILATVIGGLRKADFVRQHGYEWKSSFYLSGRPQRTR